MIYFTTNVSQSSECDLSEKLDQMVARDDGTTLGSLLFPVMCLLEPDRFGYGNYEYKNQAQ